MSNTTAMAQDDMNEMMDNVADIINLFCGRGPHILPNLTDPETERKLGEINNRFKAWCIDFGLFRCENASGDMLLEKNTREAQTARRLTKHLKDDLSNCMFMPGG